MTVLDDVFGVLAPISLTEIAEDAALLTRTDRKYLVDPATLAEIVVGVDDAVRVLDIDGERCFAYRSTYFDTPDLRSHRDAARRRPLRFKVRTRTYAATGSCWLEVKLQDRRGQTVKERIEHDVAGEATLTALARDFLGTFPHVREHVDALRPTLCTRYRRATLLCTQRVTVDLGLQFVGLDGTASIGSGGLGRLAIVETKSLTRQPGPFDRALWARGVRPQAISKYCVGMAAADPALPANKWHRLLQRHVRVEDPATLVGASR